MGSHRVEYPREDLTRSRNILREPFRVREGFWHGSLKVNLGRLETRLDCVELAKEQTRGRVTLYSTEQRGKLSSK